MSTYLKHSSEYNMQAHIKKWKLIILENYSI